MVQEAKRSLRAAYSPYSKVRVGASVLGADGKVYSGCNVENASYGATICAERTAVVKAVSEGNKEIKGVVIVTEAQEPWAPCGMCRQVLLEFGSPKTPVLLVSTKGKSRRFTLGKLCPASFSPKQMK